ncbi:MAG: hypothetical protein ACJ8FU_15720 [Xanthobacteraceae bacterium]
MSDLSPKVAKGDIDQLAFTNRDFMGQAPASSTFLSRVRLTQCEEFGRLAARRSSFINLAAFLRGYEDSLNISFIRTSGPIFRGGLHMSYDISKYGWFGWHNMSAWISSRDGRPLRQCRITDLHNERAKLHVDRAYEIPDEFLLQLTAWSKSAFECKVVARQGVVIEIEFRRSSLFERAKPGHAKIETATHSHSRQDLQMLRGLAGQRRGHRRAIGSALLVAGLACVLIALAVTLDWEKIKPTGYELAGSTASYFKKAPSEPPNSTVGR